MPERGLKENIADRRPLDTHAVRPNLAALNLAPPNLAPHRVLSRGAGHDSLSDAAQSAKEVWMKVRIEWCKP